MTCRIERIYFLWVFLRAYWHTQPNLAFNGRFYKISLKEAYIARITQFKYIINNFPSNIQSEELS